MKKPLHFCSSIDRYRHGKLTVKSLLVVLYMYAASLGNPAKTIHDILLVYDT